MNRLLLSFFAISSLAVASSVSAADAAHNVILFVPDGLRALSVTPETAPTMAAIRDQGVNFKNSHSVFPTFTMTNSSAMATGHMPGDTGVFSNKIYTGYKVGPAADSMTPDLENDAVLGDLDAHTGGNLLDETTLLEAARKAGLSTALVGKVGPSLVFDHMDRSGTGTIVVDDATGTAKGIPLSAEISAAMTAAQLPLAAPSRGVNGDLGDMNTPGTQFANVIQQNYFADVASKVVLPLLKSRNKPFVMVFWSRDPDGTQHNQGDSLGKLEPGINGPTSKLAIKNADNDLARLRATLDQLGLAATTDIVVAADHGFSTVNKQSKTSPAARGHYADTPPGALPLGFLAIDLASALGLPLFDVNDKYARVLAEHHPVAGSAFIGDDVANPDLVVATNGNSDLIYLPRHDKQIAARAVAALLKQDYVSGIFIDARLGKIPGTLPLSAVGLDGKAVTPVPAIVVNFASVSTGCAEPAMCSASIADAPQQQGQGYHGGLNRAETMNFIAAIGPDFKASFVDPAPVSNADVGRTLAQLLGLSITPKGKLLGRVIAEAMPGGAVPSSISGTLTSMRAPNGLATTLLYQQVGQTRYFDAAGFPGRTVGLPGPRLTASR